MKYAPLILSLISLQLFAQPFVYNKEKHLDVDFEECIDAQKDGFKILSISEAPTYLNFYYYDDFLYKFQSFPRIGKALKANDTIELNFICSKYKVK